MTSIRFDVERPSVREGDAESYLARARWAMKYGSRSREEAEPDLRQAIALEPSLWEPWSLLADLPSNDPAFKLRCYEEAIRRGGGPVVEWQRATLLLRLDRFFEAEQAFTAVIEQQDLNPLLLSPSRIDRATARMQLGDYTGAVSDSAAPWLGGAPEHVRKLLGQCQWLAGDLAGAYVTFTAETKQRPEFFSVWGHLCQVAHGMRHSVMPPPRESDERPPVALSGARITLERWELHECDLGPPQRAVWVWDALADLFQDRVTPVQLLAASQAPLAESDAWRFPAIVTGTPAYDFIRPNYVWRSQLLFFVGMWHLSKDHHELARQALTQACEADQSCCVEKIAAREQLRRMSAPAGVNAVPFRVLEPAPPPQPHPDLQKFVNLEMTLPELWPTRAGATLKFEAHDLGDEGLATLLSSRNLRFVARLSLQHNRITAAGMAAFRRSSHVVNVTELDLSGNLIGDDGLRNLLASAALLALESLDLSNTGLTDAGAQLLVNQDLLPLQRLILGDTPVDLVVWKQLLDRYGAGLFASGVFRTPYDPPFDRDLQVCFSNKVGEWSAGGPSGDRCELTFLLRDYVALRWRWAAAGRHKTSRIDPRDRVATVRELEQKLAAWTGKVYPVEGYEGLGMIRSGFRPLSLRCPACEVEYVWPKIEVERGDERETDRICCPEGHELN